jgi:hypothetical protein
MFGLTFLNLAFLAGIAAAAVPILIHLFSRRQAKRLDWPSIRFLKEINRQRIRRIRLRQLLLLLVRAAAIVLFALAMGRPVMTGGFLADGRAPSTVCLVIDTSYSMQAARGGTSTFEIARTQALGVVDQLGRDDGVYLITVSDRAESATPYPMQDLGLVRESIAALEPSDRAGDLAAGLELAGRLLRASDDLNKEIYLITDLQAAGWASVLDTTRTRIDLPPEVAVCVIAPEESPLPDNVAVREVRTQRQLADAGGLELEVMLANHSREALRSLPVKAEVGGTEVGESFVDLPPGGTARTRIDLPAGLASDGVPAWGRVRIPEDALAIDDSRFFVIGQDERLPVGVLADTDAASARAAAFVRLALDPAEGAGPFAARALSAEALNRAQLADLRVVVVAGLARLDQNGLELLKSFVRDGGGLLIFPSVRSDLRFYNDRLLEPFLPVKIARVVDVADDASFRLVPAVAGHPIFDGFQVGMTERLTRARFQKVVKVVPGDARVLARFRGDLPALVEGDRVLLFASSVDREWNDFPTNAAFVPLLHQAVAYLAGGRDAPGQASVGAPIERLVPAPPTPQRWIGRGPDGDEVELEVVQRGEDLMLRIPSPERVGIYRVADERQRETVAVAINPDTRESDLTTFAASRLETVFGDRPFSLVRGTGQFEASVRQVRYGRELWRAVLVLALLVLVAEVLLSRGKGAFTPAST